MHLQLDEFDSDKIKERLSLLTQERTAEEAHLEVLKSQENEIITNLDSADEALEKCDDNVSSMRLAVLSAEKDVEASQSALASVQAQIVENVRRTAALKEEYDEIEKQLSGINVDIEKLKSDAENIALVLEEKKKTLSSRRKPKKTLG